VTLKDKLIEIGIAPENSAVITLATDSTNPRHAGLLAVCCLRVSSGDSSIIYVRGCDAAATAQYTRINPIRYESEALSSAEAYGKFKTAMEGVDMFIGHNALAFTGPVIEAWSAREDDPYYQPRWLDTYPLSKAIFSGGLKSLRPNSLENLHEQAVRQLYVKGQDYSLDGLCTRLGYTSRQDIITPLEKLIKTRFLYQVLLDYRV